MKYSFNTSIGIICIASNNEAITNLYFGLEAGNSNPDKVLLECKKQLLAYLKNEIEIFTVPLKPDGTEFQMRVWDLLKQIPYGQTTSYKQMAERLGNPKLLRAVGSANGQNPIPVLIPCHRVIGADGSMVGYAGGLKIKRKLLEIEGNLRQLNLF